MNKVLTILILMLMCNACEMVSEIDYNTTEGADYIVINGFVSLESGVNVLVKKTVNANNLDADDVIENPNVWLYENDKHLRQLIKINRYKYFLPKDSVLFNKDASYSIKIEADGFATAISKPQQFVSKVSIDTIYFDVDSSFVYYEFTDDPKVDNFYSTKVNIFSGGSSSNLDSTRIVPLYVGNDNGYNGRVVKYYELGYRFTKEIFDSIQIEIYTYSKDYYDFFSSYLDYEISYGDYNYETVYPVESQVENGFGFFISYEVSVFCLRNSKKY